MKPDALLLDFGGVITKTLFECHEAMERHFGLSRGTLRWRGPFDPDTDALWRSMQADEIGEREYWRRRAAELGQLVGRAIEMKDLIAAARGRDPNLMIRPEAIATIRKAKAAGCRVGVLSNELELLYGRDVISDFDILGDLDCLIDGSWSRVIKPTPEAYARGLSALGRSAERTVFVDDQPRNVIGARSIGMMAVNFDVRDAAGSYRQVDEVMNI